MTSPLLSPADEGDEAVRSRLDHEPIIWLTTVAEDHRPHTVPVWFHRADPEVTVFSRPTTAKVRRLRGNGAVPGPDDPHEPPAAADYPAVAGSSSSSYQGTMWIAPFSPGIGTPCAVRLRAASWATTIQRPAVSTLISSSTVWSSPSARAR